MKSSIKGFSLVEVVLALGIVAFSGTALLGLFAVGLSLNRDSAEESEATRIGQSLLAERRVAPVSPVSTFALPPLDKPASSASDFPVLLDKDGEVATSPDEARYGMIYRIVPTPSEEASEVFLCLYWPAQAAADDAQGFVELFSTLRLP